MFTKKIEIEATYSLSVKRSKENDQGSERIAETNYFRNWDSWTLERDEKRAEGNKAWTRKTQDKKNELERIQSQVDIIESLMWEIHVIGETENNEMKIRGQIIQGNLKYRIEATYVWLEFPNAQNINGAEPMFTTIG